MAGRRKQVSLVTLLLGILALFGTLALASRVQGVAVLGVLAIGLGLLGLAAYMWGVDSRTGGRNW